MTETELYCRADEAIGPFLEGEGFTRVQPAEWVRQATAGYDRVAVSKGPPSKARTHFAVFMSYYPNYLTATDALFDQHKEQPRGFPCGPYLTPVGATRRPKYWSYQSPEALAKSLQHVRQCLEEAGLPWLESLRDPRVFAAEVDPVAAFDAGLAHEAAGNIEEARRSYSEMMRRFLVPIQQYGEATGLKGAEKLFVFLARKLGVEAERRERLERQLNYHPDVKPLPR
ncbi:MAG: hypothetical protein WD768_12120 [Phycisphaeraceae bacterium]